MSQNDFTIKELSFDLDIEENNDFDEVALNLTKLTNDFFVPRLDELSRSFIEGREDVVISKVVIDLGEIVLKDKRKISEAIIDRLMKEIQSLSVLNTDQFRSIEGLIRHFLRFGSLPWWANNNKKMNEFLSRSSYEEDAKKSIYAIVTKNKFHFQRFFNALNSKNRSTFFKEYLKHNYLFFSNGIMFLQKLLEGIVGKLASRDSAQIHYELFTSLVSHPNKLDQGFSLILKKVIQDFNIEWSAVQEVLALKPLGLKSFSEHLNFDENRFFSSQLSFRTNLSSLAQIRMFIEYGVINEFKNFGIPYLISEFTDLLKIDKKALRVLFLQLNVYDDPVKLFRVSKLLNINNLIDYLKIVFEASHSIFLRHSYSFVKFMELKGEINNPSLFSFLNAIMKLKSSSSSTKKDFYKSLINLISKGYHLSETILFVEFYFFSVSQEYQTDFQEVIELFYANEIKGDARNLAATFIRRLEKKENFSYATLLSSSQRMYYDLLLDQINFLNQSFKTSSWTKSYIERFIFEALTRHESSSQNPLVYVISSYAKATNLDVHKLMISLLMEFYTTDVSIENQNMIVLEYVLLVLQAKSFEIFSKTEQVFIQKMLQNKTLQHTHDLVNFTNNFIFDKTLTSRTQKHYYQLLITQVNFLNDSVVFNSWTQSFTKAFIFNLMDVQVARGQYSLLDILKIYAATNRFDIHRLVVSVLMKFYSTPALLEKGGVEIFEYVRFILKPELDFNFNKNEQRFIETIMNNENVTGKLGIRSFVQKKASDFSLLSDLQRKYYELLIEQINFLNQFVVFNSWTKSFTQRFVFNSLMNQRESNKKSIFHVLEIYAQKNRFEIHQLILPILMKFYSTPLLLEKAGAEILEYVLFVLKPEVYLNLNKKEQGFVQSINEKRALQSKLNVASWNYTSELNYAHLQQFKSQDTFFKANLYYLFEELNAIISSTTVLKLNSNLLLQILIIELKKQSSKNNQYNYQVIVERIADLAKADTKKLSSLLIERIGGKAVYNAKDVLFLHQLNDDLFSYTNLKTFTSEHINEIVNLIYKITDDGVKRVMLVKYVIRSSMVVLQLKEENYKALMHSLAFNRADKFHIILTNVLSALPYHKRNEFTVRLKQAALSYSQEKNISNEQFYERLLTEVKAIDTSVYHQIKSKLSLQMDALLLLSNSNASLDKSVEMPSKDRQQDIDDEAIIQKRYEYELQNYKPIHSLNERDFDYFLSLKNELTKDHFSQLFHVKRFKNIDDILASDVTFTDFLIAYLDDFELLLEFARASFDDPIKSRLKTLLKNELSQIEKLEIELIKLHESSFFTTLSRLEYKIFLRLFVLKSFAHYKLNARFNGAEFTFNLIENLSVNRKLNFKQTSSISSLMFTDTEAGKQIKEGIVSFFDRNNFEFIQSNVKEVEFQKNTIYFAILNDEKYGSEKDRESSASETVGFIEDRIRKMDAPYIRELLSEEKTASFFASQFKNVAFDVHVEVFKLLETSKNSVFSIKNFYQNIRKLKGATDVHIRLIFEQIISKKIWGNPSVLYVFDEIYATLKKKIPKQFKFIVALQSYYPELKLIVAPTKLISNADKLELARYYIQLGKLPRAIAHKREIHLQLLKAYINKEQLKLLIMEFSGGSMRSKYFIEITSKHLFKEVILEELEEIDEDFKIVFNLALQMNVAQLKTKEYQLYDLLLNHIIAPRILQNTNLKRVLTHLKSLTPKIYQTILKITYKLINNSSDLKLNISQIEYLNFEAFSEKTATVITFDLPVHENGILNSIKLKKSSSLVNYVLLEANLYVSYGSEKETKPDKNDEQEFRVFLNQLRYFIEFKSFNRVFDLNDEKALYLSFLKFKSKLILKKQLHAWSKYPSKLRILFQLFPEKELKEFIDFVHAKQVASITTFNEVLKVFGYREIEAYLNIKPSEKFVIKIFQLWSKQRTIISSPYTIIYSLFEELLLHKDFDSEVFTEQLETGLKRLNSAQVLLVKSILTQSNISRVTAKSEQSIVFENNEVIHESEGSIYINNAGLILVWPFLSTLFNKLELLAGNTFVDDYNLQKAILLTQYVIFEGDETEETNLVLNKLLCGVPPDFFVDTEIELSDTEKSVAKTLLNAVTGNWEQLSNTSISTLKETFLKREGIIQKVDDNYKLIVEKKPFDMLLRTIPWNITMIQNSFMSFRLFVEWEN